MGWIYLFVAGILEVVWALSLKSASGFNNIPAIGIVIVAMSFSTLFLTLSVRTLPIAIAYAVWTGIGIIGTTVFSVFLSKAKLSFTDIILICILVIGIAGLQLTHTPE